MSKQIDIKNLSPEDKKLLLQQLEEEQKTAQREITEKRNKYKENVERDVTELFPLLKSASETLAKVKQAVYNRLQKLVIEKAIVFEREEDQYSHSFSNKEGNITIIIGYNMIDGWDDTANTGMAKVNDYLKSLGKNKEARILVDSITKLLSKDSKGNLKASRVLQLKQIADKTENKEFIDAIQIIQDAYRPVRSKEYVRCLYKNEMGEQVILPLSITDAQLVINAAENS